MDLSKIKDLKDLQTLLDVMGRYGLVELEIEGDGKKIRLRKSEPAAPREVIGIPGYSMAPIAAPSVAVPAAGALTILAGAFALAHLSMGPIGWTLLGITAALSLFAGGVTYSTAQSINETRRLSDEQRKATLEYLKNKCWSVIR